MKEHWSVLRTETEGLLSVNQLLCFVHSPDSNYQAMTSKWPAVWVKVSSSWICIALYVWTLVAPLVLVNRDFE